jgi:DNA mismatch repair protein MutS2
LIENTIREIKEEKRNIAEIKNEYNINKEKIVKEAEKLNVPAPIDNNNVKFKAGDSVMMIENGTKGYIVAVDDEDKMVLVEFGGFKFRLSQNQIKLSEPDKSVKKDTSDYIKYDVKSRIDVRGLRTDECLKKIDDFVQDALVNNVEQVTIVHGKGTGALKIAIHDFLKYQHYVKSYRLGELVEGGAGVTVVDL